MPRSVREQYEAARRAAEPHLCNGRCVDCRDIEQLAQRLERDGWRCCEECGAFDVAPEAETDFCSACAEVADAA